MATCCNLVGNFDITAKGIISVTSQGSSQISLISAGGKNAYTISPSSGTVSIAAYASDKRYKGCPGRANVSIPWIIRSDCEKNVYLFGGAGRSSISGEVGDYAKFPSLPGIVNPVTEYDVVSASAGSGPSSLYEDSVQKDGYGLIYKGNPWNIDTLTEAGCTINLTSYGIGGYGECKLQNIQLQCVPGQIPVVNMSFIYSLEEV
jgi:hypothetical protein